MWAVPHFGLKTRWQNYVLAHLLTTGSPLQPDTGLNEFCPADLIPQLTEDLSGIATMGAIGDRAPFKATFFVLTSPPLGSGKAHYFTPLC